LASERCSRCAMARVGLVGLAIIGTAFARNLRGDGDEVAGFDILPDRVAILESIGRHGCHSVCEVAERSDVVFTAIATPGALATIAEGPEGLIHAGHRDFVVADVSTLALVVEIRTPCRRCVRSWKGSDTPSTRSAVSALVP